jgi:hypothetical protein
MLNTTTTATTTQQRVSKKERWFQLAQRVHEIREMTTLYEEERDQLMTELKELSDNKSLAYKGFFLVRSMAKGRVAYKDIPQLKGVNLDLYRGNPVESWRLTKESL